MFAVNSTAVAAMQSSKSQITVRSEDHPVRNKAASRPEHEHGHDRVKFRHGGKRSMQIFRHEIFLALKARFQSDFRPSPAPANPYSSSGSPEDVATEVVYAARDNAERNPAAAVDTLTRVRQSVEQAINVSREFMNTDAGAEALAETTGLVKSGLDRLESDAQLISASSLSIEARSKQSSKIQIRTLEGDVVKFSLRRVNTLSASNIALETTSSSSSLTEVSVSSTSRLVLKVDGDLNDAEFEAIRNVFAQAELLAENFFAGDLNAALEVAAGLEYDSDQLARVSIKLRSDQRISAEQTILQNTAALPSTDDIPTTGSAALTAPAIVLPETTPDTVASPDPISTTDTAVVDAEDAVSDARSPLSAFGALTDYLGKIADYLNQSFEMFDSALRDGAASRMRFEFSQSLRLEILQAVIEQTSPEATQDDATTSSDAIQQLADKLGA